MPILQQSKSTPSMSSPSSSANKHPTAARNTDEIFTGYESDEEDDIFLDEEADDERDNEAEEQDEAASDLEEALLQTVLSFHGTAPPALKWQKLDVTMEIHKEMAEGKNKSRKRHLEERHLMHRNKLLRARDLQENGEAAWCRNGCRTGSMTEQCFSWLTILKDMQLMPKMLYWLRA
ncbi:hypothetical protein H0H92_010187 [Tricholoma furcatifolium]|nr:hypothetical protein H0H92_010187 [Tricholoma furcatifolium]